MSSFVRTSLVILLVLVFPVLLFAQLPIAAISGTVKDQSGAVLPGASISVTNLETSQARLLVSDENGRYKAAALSVGRYELTAELPGFRMVVRQVTLVVGQEAVVDFELPVGEVSEKVEVRGEAPLVDTRTSSLGGLVNDQKVADLPLNGRNFVDLAFLQTGVHEHKNVQLIAGMSGTWFSSNGAPLRSNNHLMDGAIMTNLWGANSASISGTTLGVEGIREFRVVTNTFSAEYGMTMGSQIEIVSKSGGNAFHGSLFHFLRNSALDARNFFDRKTASNPRRLPSFKRNNFGGAIGGPIVEDKTFFHFTYEGLEERLGVTTVSNTLPASAKVDGGLVPVINPVIKPFLKLYPDPNLPGNQFTFPFNQPTSESFFQGRGDHTFSSSDSFFVRYTFHDAEVTRPRAFPGFTDALQSRSQYATLSETHLFSSNLLNTFRFSYSRTNMLANSQGVKAPEFAMIPDRQMGNLIVGGLSDMGPDPGTTTGVKQNIFTWSDDVFYTRGDHSLKFGVVINRFQMYSETGLVKNGYIVFPNISNFLLGRALFWFAETPGSSQARTYHFTTLGHYIQDDWQVNPSLTLNLGLRYEFHTVPEEQHGKQSGLRNLATDKDVTIGALFRNPSLKNFGPRVGFAWNINGDSETVVRGGFGTVYDIGNIGSALLQVGIAQPPFSLRTIVIAPTLTIPLTFPPPGVGGAIRTIDYNLEQPHLLQYNLTVERALPKNTVLRLAYGGSRGLNLMQNKEGNPRIAQIQPDGRKFWPATTTRRNRNWDTVTLIDAGGNSWYNSLQLGLEKRFGSLQFQSSYTWSKTIDDTQGQLSRESNTAFSFGTDPEDRKVDQGLADFDVAHNWKLNWIYRLPGTTGAGAASKLLEGWWISGIVTLQSGRTFTPVLLANRSRSGVLGNSQELDRPNLVAGRKPDDIVRGGPDQYFDPSAFTIPAAGFLGTAGRNILRGPGYATVDFAVAKDTGLRFLGESGKVEFRAEIFNLLNRANFGPPDRRVFGGVQDVEAPLPTAGKINTTSGSARQIQFGLKLIF
ncbi:MAG: TonB-dependent receptor [Acidobacteria bacterium]|nr:TonB-dependent receptor [Acidobacteriota bacterium]